jgi:hypothetical protein
MFSFRNISWIVFTVALFVILTPGVLVVIPPFYISEIKFAVTDPLSLLPLVIHGLLFAVILLCLQRYVKREQKIAKATGQSLIKTIATNITKTVKTVASRVTGGAVSSASPAPTVSSASTVTTTATPRGPVTTPSRPVTTPSKPVTTPSRPVTTSSTPVASNSTT